LDSSSWRCSRPARQWRALRAVGRGQLPLDLAEIPPHAIDAAVHVRAGESPGLADLPDEEECEQIAVLDQPVHRLRDACAPLVEVDVRPELVLFQAKATAATASS